MIEFNYDEGKDLFYCDGCGKYLGEEKADEDYWIQPGEFELSLNVYGGWYKLKKNFCSDCVKEFQSNLKAYLESIGFEQRDFF
jgi:hypothetical protein